MQPIDPTRYQQARYHAAARCLEAGKLELAQVADEVLQLQPGGQLIYVGAGGWVEADMALDALEGSGHRWRLF